MNIKEALSVVAQKAYTSILKIIRDLIANGLDQREDQWLSRLADERDNIHTIKHEDAWK